MPKIKKSEILFIVNAASGNRKVSRIIKSIKTVDESLSCIITREIKDVKRVFDACLKDYRVFVIVGGDGSVNEAIKYLHNKPDKYLAVYPNGSGNGFARELGFRRDIKALLHAIYKGELMDLDVIKINQYLSINVSGLGFDAHIAHEFAKTKRRGLLNYIWLSLKSLAVFKSFRATIVYEGEKIQGDYQMISIANTRQFGNNALIAPAAKPNDGIIEVVLVKPFPFWFYPVFVYQLLSGRLKKSKYIDGLSVGNPLTIQADYNRFHIDGEPVEFQEPVNISVERESVRIIKTAFNRL